LARLDYCTWLTIATGFDVATECKEHTTITSHVNHVTDKDLKKTTGEMQRGLAACRSKLWCRR